MRRGPLTGSGVQSSFGGSGGRTMVPPNAGSKNNSTSTNNNNGTAASSLAAAWSKFQVVYSNQASNQSKKKKLQQLDGLLYVSAQTSKLLNLSGAGTGAGGSMSVMEEKSRIPGIATKCYQQLEHAVLTHCQQQQQQMKVSSKVVAKSSSRNQGKQNLGTTNAAFGHNGVNSSGGGRDVMEGFLFKLGVYQVVVETTLELDPELVGRASSSNANASSLPGPAVGENDEVRGDEDDEEEEAPVKKPQRRQLHAPPPPPPPPQAPSEGTLDLGGGGMLWDGPVLKAALCGETSSLSHVPGGGPASAGWHAQFAGGLGSGAAAGGGDGAAGIAPPPPPPPLPPGNMFDSNGATFSFTATQGGNAVVVPMQADPILQQGRLHLGGEGIGGPMIGVHHSHVPQPPPPPPPPHQQMPPPPPPPPLVRTRVGPTTSSTSHHQHHAFSSSTPPSAAGSSSSSYYTKGAALADAPAQRQSVMSVVKHLRYHGRHIHIISQKENALPAKIDTTTTFSQNELGDHQNNNLVSSECVEHKEMGKKEAEEEVTCDDGDHHDSDDSLVLSGVSMSPSLGSHTQPPPTQLLLEE